MSVLCKNLLVKNFNLLSLKVHRYRRYGKHGLTCVESVTDDDALTITSISY